MAISNLRQSDAIPRKVLIGAGASYAGDRVEPATDLAAKGKLDYLVYETLAERTIAMANVERAQNPEGGYNGLLEDRFINALPHCHANGTRVVTSMGAANPAAALRKTVEIIKRLGLDNMTVAAVVGDDVLKYCRDNADTLTIMETGLPLSSLPGEMVSANAYLGAESIVSALEQGADIVITGRVADCSLFLAPMIHEFKWNQDNWNLLGKGQIGADMVECGANVSGGFFADPEYKDVERLYDLGYPILEAYPDGSTVVTKLEGTGGKISRATCLEQMLYEVHDPSNYITPDVVVDFTSAQLEEIGQNRVRISGGGGRPRPEQLKVSVGIKEGWIGEAELTYSGLGCVERARLAEQVVRERLRIGQVELQELRVDYIGINSLHGEQSLPQEHPPYEVRIRFAGRSQDRRNAIKLGNEVETLVGKGPASSSLPRKSVREVLAIYSCLIPRSAATVRIIKEEA